MSDDRSSVGVGSPRVETDGRPRVGVESDVVADGSPRVGVDSDRVGFVFVVAVDDLVQQLVDLVRVAVDSVLDVQLRREHAQHAEDVTT